MEYELLAILKCQTIFNLQPDVGIVENSRDSSYIILELFSKNEWGRTVKLQFWEGVPPIPRVLESTENVTINFPISHFNRLYSLFQDAFYNQKYYVKLKTEIGQWNVWYPQFEFIPK